MDNEVERKRIGARIAEIRQANGLTQADVEERTGIKRNHLSRLEAGRYNPGFDTLQKVSEAMGMRVDFVPIDKD